MPPGFLGRAAFVDGVGLSGRAASRDGEVDAAEAVDAPERPITSQQRDGSHGRLPVGVGCRVGTALLAVLPEGADEEPAPLLLARSPLFGRLGHWWPPVPRMISECLVSLNKT